MSPRARRPAHVAALALSLAGGAACPREAPRAPGPLPQAADVYYEALVRRTPTPEPGRLAQALRWSPADCSAPP